MTEGWSLRRFTHSDIPKVAEFRQSFPLSPLVKVEQPEYHEWKCRRNPAEPGYIWLVEDGGRIVATASMTPKKMKILGKEALAAETGDTFTLPEYQGKGIFTSLVKNTTAEAVGKGIGFIYGLPNKNSLPGYLSKLDYRQVTSPQLYYLGRPLNIKKILGQRIGSRSIASVLSPLLEVVSWVVFKLCVIRSGKSTVSISQGSTFPEDIEELWPRVSTSYDVMLVRDNKYLEWRYVAAPNRYLILIARNKEGEISGYMVARISDVEDRRVGFIVDFLCLEDSPKVFRRLFFTLLEVFRANKVDHISTWAMKGSFYYKNLVKLGFLPWTKIPLICYKSELGHQILDKAYKWHFTQGDSDGI